MAGRRKAQQPSPVITTEEWLEELFRNPNQNGHDDGYLSTAEIADRTGKSLDRVRRELRRAQGRDILQVKYRPMTCIAGTQRTVPTYRVTQ